jgi:hypothetical protein
MNIEEREKSRLKMAKWLKNNPEKREANRLRNAAWRAKDRAKYNQSMNEWRSNNPDKVIRYKLKARYGITPEQYAKMFAAQNGNCAICGQPESAKHNRSKQTQNLAVDHSHTSGKIRGLLCMDCNRGLGKFHDDPILLQKAIDYIVAHQNL